MVKWRLRYQVRAARARSRAHSTSAMAQKRQPPGVAQQQLAALAERRSLAIPHPASRVNLRQLGIYAEVRERFGDKEPASQSDVRRWMKGELEKKGTPSGLQFANDLAKLLGFEGVTYMLEAIQLDHFFPQADMPKGWAGHVANLVVLETGFNRTAEFKERGLAKQAFFGIKSYNSNRAWLRWQIEHPGEHSLNFYQSADNRDGQWSIAIRASDGLTRSAIPAVVSDASTESVDDDAVATGEAAPAPAPAAASEPAPPASLPPTPAPVPVCSPPLVAARISHERAGSPPPKVTRPRKPRAKSASPSVVEVAP